MSKIPNIKVKVENVDSIIFARDTNIQFQYVYDSYYKASYKKFDPVELRLLTVVILVA